MTPSPRLVALLREGSQLLEQIADELAEQAKDVDTATDSIDDVTEAAIDRLLADRGYDFEEDTCGS